jgi:hypothetical protein
VNLFQVHRDQQPGTAVSFLTQGEFGWCAMSLHKITVALVAVMVAAAAVTALAGTSPDAKIDLAATAGQVEGRAPVSACPEAPWPFGCQWREPVRRIQRSARPL